MDVEKEVKSLIEKAEKAGDSGDALKFSQAACNVANAMSCIQSIPKSE